MNCIVFIMLKGMYMFDVQKAIKDSRLSRREVIRLQDETRREFPDDPMLYELHMIRALRQGIRKLVTGHRVKVTV